jgi:hypothetical protein
VLTVALEDHAVLGIAEFHGSEPDGPVGFVNEAPLLQIFNGMCYRATLIELALALPGVEADPEVLEVLPYLPEHHGEGKIHEVLAGIRKGASAVLLAHILKSSTRYLFHVCSPVPLLGEGVLFMEKSLIPGKHGLTQKEHLPASIVYVVLPGDLIPCCLKEICQRAAYRGAPAVSQVKGTGRVSAYELDLHLPSSAHVSAKEGRPLFKERAQRTGDEVETEGEVDITRPRYLDALKHVLFLNGVSDLLGYGLGGLPEGPGEPHGNRGGKVTEGLIPWDLDLDESGRLHAKVGKGIPQGGEDGMFHRH